MTELVWGTPSERSHEFGISHGVIDLDGTVIPWSGLTGVVDSVDNSNWNAPIFDGTQYANFQMDGQQDFGVSALAFPDEALPILGVAKLAEGMYVSGQSHARFNMSYRTRVDESNYRLHFIWNLTADRGPLKHTTNAAAPILEPVNIKMSAVTLPAPYPNQRNISRYVLSTVDITDPGDISTLEDQLYGTDITDPEFPTQTDIITALIS